MRGHKRCSEVLQRGYEFTKAEGGCKKKLVGNIYITLKLLLVLFRLVLAATLHKHHSEMETILRVRAWARVVVIHLNLSGVINVAHNLVICHHCLIAFFFSFCLYGFP